MPGNDTDLVDVVGVGGEGKLAGACIFLVVEVVAVVVHYNQVGDLAVLLGDLVFTGHQDSLGDLFLQALAVVGLQVKHEAVDHHQWPRQEQG